MMWSLKEAQNQTGLPYSVLRNLCLDKKIVFIRSGVKYYLNVDSLMDYLSTGEADNNDAAEM